MWHRMVECKLEELHVTWGEAESLTKKKARVEWESLVSALSSYAPPGAKRISK